MSEKMLNSNGDVAHELTEEEVAELDKAMSFFDKAKVSAFCNCVIDLAEVNGLNLVELLYALRNLIMAVQVRLVKKSGELGEKYGMTDDGQVE